MNRATSFAFLLPVLCCTTAALSYREAAAFITVYGGPEYSFATSTGFISPGQATPYLADTAASPVNNIGAAVGYARKFINGTNVGDRGLRWDSSGFIELGTLGTSGGGATASQAYSVNNSGTAVGYALKYISGTSYGERAVRWDSLIGTPTELGDLGTSVSGSTSSSAYVVNNSGASAGYALKYTSGTDLGRRAVRWDALSTTAIELDNLGTSGTGSTFSEAYGLNDTGAVVGYARKYTGGTEFGTRAVRWDATGTTATELDNLGLSSAGSTSSVALVVNFSGAAAGYAWKHVSGAYLGARAVRWDASGTTATEFGNLGLDSGGSTQSSAFDMNNSGIAVGYANKYVSGSAYGHARFAGTD